MVAEVVVPRQVLKERVAQQRDEVALAAGRAQLRADQQQIGQRVAHEVRVVAVPADVAVR